jgi:hypothetical protein
MYNKREFKRLITYSITIEIEKEVEKPLWTNIWTHLFIFLIKEKKQNRTDLWSMAYTSLLFINSRKKSSVYVIIFFWMSLSNMYNIVHVNATKNSNLLLKCTSFNTKLQYFKLVNMCKFVHT